LSFNRVNQVKCFVANNKNNNIAEKNAKTETTELLTETRRLDTT